MSVSEQPVVCVEDDLQELYLLATILPPPISLDTLCAICGYSPVKMLQKVDQLVQTDQLSLYSEKGAGYYFLSDHKLAQQRLQLVPQSRIREVAEKAVSVVYENTADNAVRWLSLANIYQVSGMPVKHFKEVIMAGHYCHDLNLPIDAAKYYRLALDTMEKGVLLHEDQVHFIDASIGLCTCRDSSLFKDVRARYLELSLEFCKDLNDPCRRVKLEVLIAKSYFRTPDIDKASEHLQVAEEILSRHDLPTELHLSTTVAKSELYFWQGFVTKAIECYESAIGSHEELSNDINFLKSYARLAWAYGVHGETARGVGMIKAVLAKAVEIRASDLKRFATLVMVIILSDAGRIEEGEVYLEQVFNVPDEYLDHYTLWPGNGKRAYFAYCRKDYEKAFLYQDMAWQHSKALGSPHHRGADNIEIMLGLEELGMVHPEWNFNYDVQRLLAWPDVLMQGIAYRFLALREYRRQAPLEQVKKDLKQSLKLLHQAGGKIELAHAQVLMARVHIDEAKAVCAEKLLKKAWEVYSKVNPQLFPTDLKPFLDRTFKNALWVDSLLEVSNALSCARSREELLSKIIRQSMRIAGAERGAIFFRQNAKLEAVASRNLHNSEIESPAFARQIEAIENVFESGKESVCRTGDTVRGENHPGACGWLGCFPIRLKSRTFGVIFMDRGPTQLELPDNEISLLRIITNQAAVALENMEAYQEVIDLKNDLEAETHFYRKNCEFNLHHGRLIGQSKKFKEMLNLVNQVADSDTTVMITGETGVGKDVVAQTIHQHSQRAAKPFIAVNVVSLSPELIASELFGHEKGAFTGATQVRKGRFELASQGTLFLDDIDAFSLDIQAKMLRVLENKEFERAGGTQTLTTNFRLLAASNRNIEDLVDQGLFRSDFYFRLNVFPIRVPPLRERIEDIPLLAMYFMDMFSKRLGKQFDGIDRADMDKLRNYYWPGNIRELRHVIERAVLLSREKCLVIPPLDSLANQPAIAEKKIVPFREMEARHILMALKQCGGKISGKGGAAELLELRPTTLHSKMRRLGIQKKFLSL